MSLIGESLTIGLLLSLVFGALFFYIYSRLSYVEKRISLMENILLDIKITQEQMPTRVLPQIPPNIQFQQVAYMPHVEANQHTNEILPSVGMLPNLTEFKDVTDLTQELNTVPDVQDVDTVQDLQEMNYESVLDEAHNSPLESEELFALSASLVLFPAMFPLASAAWRGLRSSGLSPCGSCGSPKTSRASLGIMIWFLT